MMIRLLGCALIAACATAIGCRPAEQIQSYDVPKESSPAVVAASPATGPAATASTAAMDRMLAAILPDGDRAWFFKVTGPTDLVDAHADEFETFLASVRLAPGKPHPDWQLPKDWQAGPGSAVRAATLLIPTDTKPLELSVTVLPWAGGSEALASNVNRWRGQMQLAPVDEKGLAASTREIKAGDATMTLVDLEGHMSGGMTPPFAGGAMAPSAPPAAPAPAASGGVSSLPPGHPAISAPTSPVSASFTFDTPAGWQQRPAGGIRKAEFHIDDGGKSAVLTAIDFPADSPPMMSDPAANVNRWRGEVGLPQQESEDLKKSLQPIEIDGIKAFWVDVVPGADEPGQSQAERGTLAAMVTHGDSIWFFKLTGDRDVVATQRDKFHSFLKSLRFTAAGAIDGN
jgi:hypothetical protein